MRATLFPFQESALADLHEKIKKAHAYWSEKDPQVISFTAPGAGKTITSAALALRGYYLRPCLWSSGAGFCFRLAFGYAGAPMSRHV